MGCTSTQSIKITTDPEGATVSINENPIGTSPISHEIILSDLGDFIEVSVEKEGFVPQKKQLQKEEFPDKVPSKQFPAEVDFVLVQRIDITSQPSNATVLINGKRAGFTALSYDLKPNDTRDSLQVLIEKKGYESQTKILERGSISKLFPSKIHFVLSEDSQIIDITTDPPGASISIEGEFIGKSPTSFETNSELGDSFNIVIKKRIAGEVSTEMDRVKKKSSGKFPSKLHYFIEYSKKPDVNNGGNGQQQQGGQMMGPTIVIPGGH